LPLPRLNTFFHAPLYSTQLSKHLGSTITTFNFRDVIEASHFLFFNPALFPLFVEFPIPQVPPSRVSKPEKEPTDCQRPPPPISIG